MRRKTDKTSKARKAGKAKRRASFSSLVESPWGPMVRCT